MQPSFPIKLTMGMVSGSTAGYVCTPAEVVLVRMTSDGARKAEHRWNYHNAFDALFRFTVVLCFVIPLLC